MDQENVLLQEGNPESGEEMMDVNVPAVDAEAAPEEEISGTVKKRLGQQEKRHKREIRALQDQVSQMQHFILQSQAQQQPQGGGDMQQAQQQPMQQQQQQSYDPYREMDMQRLQDDFNRDLAKASEKYEDFEDISRDPRLPFTQSIKEILHVVPNPGEVIYALGTNQDELYRISRLSQHAQAKELVKLSSALQLKEKNAPKAQQQSKVMGQIKSNVPAASEQQNSPAYFRKMLRSRGK
jgi:hypothetical protein